MTDSWAECPNCPSGMPFRGFFSVFFQKAPVSCRLLPPVSLAVPQATQYLCGLRGFQRSVVSFQATEQPVLSPFFLPDARYAFRLLSMRSCKGAPLDPRMLRQHFFRSSFHDSSSLLFHSESFSVSSFQAAKKHQDLIS